ncbi:MAG TPA: hypothetical protein VHP33_14215 [Polyangiaceae bacterium]|nr:hypothetical protein [Polyangiaceae bacterium]
MLDLALFFFGHALGLDALFLGQASGAFLFALTLLVELQLRLGGGTLGLLFGSKLGFGLLLVGARGDGQGAFHLDIDVCPRDFQQVIGKSVDEAVKDPLNV